MEVKINKEIRNYTESVYFGLSLRQFLFSLLAVGVAIVIYFCCNKNFGMEITTWLCVLSAFPFAALGFICYHGMTAEQLLITWIKSEILMPKHLTFKGKNTYYIMKGKKK